ncbi:hypothetical protein ACWGLF_46980 [Streptomyces puniciscabiei]
MNKTITVGIACALFLGTMATPAFASGPPTPEPEPEVIITSIDGDNNHVSAGNTNTGENNQIGAGQAGIGNGSGLGATPPTTPTEKNCTTINNHTNQTLNLSATELFPTNSTFAPAPPLTIPSGSSALFCGIAPMPGAQNLVTSVSYNVGNDSPAQIVVENRFDSPPVVLANTTEPIVATTTISGTNPQPDVTVTLTGQTTS